MRIDREVVEFALEQCLKLHNNYIIGKTNNFPQFEINIGKITILEWILEMEKEE